MCYGVCEPKSFFLWNKNKKIFHVIIAIVALISSFYFSLVFAVRLTNGEDVFVWNIFPHITSFSFLSWIGITCSVIISTLFITQPICEVLGAIVLWVYCLFDRDCELYDDFEVCIMKEEEPRYRSSGTLRWRNPKYDHDDCDD